MNWIACCFGAPVTVRVRGGLLGHWSVWVKSAVELLERCHAASAMPAVDAALLALELWLGRPAPVEVMRAALDTELGGQSGV